MRSLLLAPLAVILLSGCVDPGPDVATTPSALSSPGGQGSQYQGSQYQGSQYQGSQYQGSQYQGSQYQGAQYLGATIGEAEFENGTLVVWRKQTRWPFRWGQRYPDKICMWDANLTAMQLPCTSYSVSPQAGVTFSATFVKSGGEPIVGRVRIGTGSTDATAVVMDNSVAMHPLMAHETGSSCGTVTCEGPNKCRRNCDLWLYRLELADALDAQGNPLKFCPDGQQAIAIPGTYDRTGQYSPGDATNFTFACVNGTIAKCTRWGYRPFGHARQQCGANCFLSIPTELQPYHQTCIRAAAADYCSNGHSFTQDGTLIDIWDYDSGNGFVPRTDTVVPNVTAFAHESEWDPIGANQIVTMRYEELVDVGGHGSIEDVDPDVGCAGRFYLDETPPEGYATWRRRLGGPWGNPSIGVETATQCSHSERTVGKWLDASCSACTGSTSLPSHCTDPASAEGWNLACRTYAETSCQVTTMTSHSECVGGTKLNKYATGCTVRVCDADAACCGSSWTWGCVALANSLCRGGREGMSGPLTVGFCGTSM